MAIFPDAPGIIELLVRRCQENIAGIRRENGYTTDVQPPIYDKAFNAFTAPRLPAAGVSIVADQPLDLVESHRYEARLLVIRVEGWLREIAVGSLTADIERFIVDVYRAMVADVHQGGLAIDTKPREVVRVEHEDPKTREGGFTAVYEISLRWLVGDPTVVQS
jgi:hypothetical protein